MCLYAEKNMIIENKNKNRIISDKLRLKAQKSMMMINVFEKNPDNQISSPNKINTDLNMILVEK